MTYFVKWSQMNYEMLIAYAKRHLDTDQFRLLVESGMPLTGAHGLRRYVAERDLEAFARLYFPQEFTLEPPDIHRKLFGLMHDIRDRALTKKPGLKLALAIPRGHAKSTLFARILPTHALLFGYSPLTILLGNTQQASERLLINIRTELETNEAIVEDFGFVRGDVWTQNHINTINGAAIRAFGVGNGAVRGVSQPGQRPSLIIGDDLDDDAQVRSAVQLEAATEWFDKAVMGLGDNVAFTTSTVVVGTIIRKTSLMQHVLDSPDFTRIIEQGVKKFSGHPELWEEWKSFYLQEAKEGRKPADPQSDRFYQAHKPALLEGTDVLWPRNDAYYQMMLFRLSRGDKAFFSEIQNSPQESGGNLGKLPLVLMPTDLSEYQLLAALDPTIKGGKKNDKAAWIEILFHRRRKEMIVSFCNAEQRPASKTIEFAVNRLRQSPKRYDGFWVEGNAAGTLIADGIQQRLTSEGLHYNAVTVNNSAPKEERISILSDYAARGQFFAVDSIDPEFINEWDGFGSGHRWDDALDGAATIAMQLKAAGLLDLV